MSAKASSSDCSPSRALMISNPVTSPLSSGEGIGGSVDGASVVRVVGVVVSVLVAGGEVVAGASASVVRVVDGASVVRVVGVVVSALVAGGEVAAAAGAAVVRVVEGVAVAVASIAATSADSCSSETAVTVSVPSP